MKTEEQTAGTALSQQELQGQPYTACTALHHIHWLQVLSFPENTIEQPSLVSPG